MGGGRGAQGGTVLLKMLPVNMLGRWPESYHVVDVRDRYLGIVAGQIQSREFWGFEPRKLL